jgi:hypothetical protein
MDSSAFYGTNPKRSPKWRRQQSRRALTVPGSCASDGNGGKRRARFSRRPSESERSASPTRTLGDLRVIERSTQRVSQRMEEQPEGLGSTSPAPFLSLVEAVELGEIRSWLSSRPPQERLAALLGDLVNLGERVRLRRSRLPSGRCNPLARKRPLERARRLHAAVPCLLPQSPPDRLEAELAEFRQAPSSPFSSQRREVLPGRGHGPRPRVRQRLARSEEPDKACRPERSMKPHWPLGYLAEAASLQGKRLWGPGSAPFGAAMDSSAFIGKAVLTIESRPTIGRRAATVSPTCARS